MRAGQELESFQVAELPQFQRFHIQKIGDGDSRRVYIQLEGTRDAGWISAKTKRGEPLIMKEIDYLFRNNFDGNRINPHLKLKGQRTTPTPFIMEPQSEILYQSVTEVSFI